MQAPARTSCVARYWLRPSKICHDLSASTSASFPFPIYRASGQPQRTRTPAHPALSLLGIGDLWQDGHLIASPGQDIPTPDDVFGPFPLPGAARSSAIGPSSSVLPASSSVLDEANMPNAGQQATFFERVVDDVHYLPGQPANCSPLGTKPITTRSSHACSF